MTRHKFYCFIAIAGHVIAHVSKIWTGCKWLCDWAAVGHINRLPSRVPSACYSGCKYTIQYLPLMDSGLNEKRKCRNCDSLACLFVVIHPQISLLSFLVCSLIRSSMVAFLPLCYSETLSPTFCLLGPAADPRAE